MSTKGINFPKTRLGLAKMNKLSDAAEGLFTTKGFYDTSIVDICKMADTAVGTFYIYFDTKIDVYRYLVNKHVCEIGDRMKEAISTCSDPAEKKREAIRAFIKYAKGFPTAYDIILGGFSLDKSMFLDCLKSFSDLYMAEIFGNADSSAEAYSLIGISGMLGLKSISEKMNDEEINKMIDNVTRLISR